MWIPARASSSMHNPQCIDGFSAKLDGRRSSVGEAAIHLQRVYPFGGRVISTIEGSLPIHSQGPQPNVLPGLVEQLVPVVAPASLGGSDADPS